MHTATLSQTAAMNPVKRLHPATVLLACAMFTTGFSGLVNEYVLATTATYILGNSVFQWSMLIATMMACMGIGGWTQQHFIDDYIVEKFAGVEILLALVGGFAPLANYVVFAFEPEAYQVASIGLAALIGFMIGFEIPLVMRINAQYTDSLKTNAAWIFALDYVGSFAGAMVWIYYLLPNHPLTEVSFLVSGTNFAVATVTMIYFGHAGVLRLRKTAAALVMLTAVLLGFGYTYNRAWSMSLEQRFYEDRIVLSKTSKFQHIVVTEDRPTGNVQLFLNGNKQFSSLDEAIYHEFLVHPAMSAVPEPANVLILGGGDGLALREVLKYRSVKTVTLVDLDPVIVDLARTDPVLSALNKGAFRDARVRTLEDPAFYAQQYMTKPVYMETGYFDEHGRPATEKVAHVSVLNVDASKYLETVRGSFDVILIDFPDPNSEELAKLYSTTVFGHVRDRLAANGVIAIQATSPYHAKEAYLTIGMTMRASGLGAIPYHQNVPSFGDWGWYLGFRGSEEREARLRERIVGLESYNVDVSYISPDLFRASLFFGNDWLKSDKAGVNTLANPLLLEQYLRQAWKID